MNEALAKVTPMEVIDFDITEEALVAMEEEYKGMEITNSKDYQAIVSAIAVTRGYRVQVKEAAKAAKVKAQAFIKDANAERDRLTDRLFEIETPLKATKKVVDDEKEAEKAEKERLEKVRVAEIQVRITSINNMVTGIGSLTAEQLDKLMTDVAALNIYEDEYQEFSDHAVQVQADAFKAVELAHKERVKLDQEAAAHKTEGERLAKEREAQEKEAERLEEAEIAQREQAAKKRARIELERKEQQDILDAQRLAQEAEAKRLKDIQDKIEADKKEEEERKEHEKWMKKAEEREKELAAAAKLQTEKDAKEKVEREKAKAERQEALKPDKQKLLEMADMLEGLILPNIKDKEAEVIRFQTRADLDVICEKVRRKVDTL